MERIDTQRLYLRELQREDAVRMSEYRNKKEVAFYQSWWRYPYKKAVKRVEYCLKHPFEGKIGNYHLAVILKENEEMIGDYYLEVIDEKSLIIGYTFDSTYWHHGYARETLKVLLRVLKEEYGFKMVFAHVYDDNYRSIRLLESMNFKQFDSSKILGDISFKLEL
ncbi:GNAT family N-acetyltransferase [uncultured Thomasclavelia sp.]|uniref:GNAT family N-acetyltransferase n=1 Tax=uncultured Thomasclavelia sp. TaxID=3025759 RepID=UPI0025E491DF|nr:GNAT family N-acetyltransferase [uncultured Thomasclavelia sp.]